MALRPQRSGRARRPAWFWDELRAPVALPAISIGVVLGVVELLTAASFGALILAGPLAVHLPAATGLFLFGALITVLVIALGTSQPGVIGGAQDTPAVVLGVSAAALAADLPAGEARFLTIVLLVLVGSLLTGAGLFLLGRLGLGNMIRFMPYPVVGGFLAGTGWLLTLGGLRVVVDFPLTLESLPSLARTDLLVHWLPAAALGVTLVVVQRKFDHVLVLPAVLALATTGFFVTVALTGTGLAVARADGWLVGGFPDGSLWRPWVAEAVTAGDWSAVLGQAGNLGTVVLLAALTLLLNLGGIEVATQRDLDVNRELQVAGAASFAAGLVGGMPGYHGLSLSSMVDRSGARARLVGVTMAAVCVVGLIAGGSLLSLIPKMLMGGLLVFLGLNFLLQWVWQARRSMPVAEHMVVLLILGVMAALGVVQGIAVGLAAAVVLFVVASSKIDVVRHALPGATMASRVERTASQRRRLRSSAQSVLILRLQGFLFFGTANRLLVHLRARLETRPPLRFLVVDCARVTGIDSSAALTFRRAQQIASSQDVIIVLTGLSRRVTTVLASGLEGCAADGTVKVFDDLDHGMEWVEERLLRGEQAVGPDSLQEWLSWLLGDATDLDRFFSYLEPVDVSPGASVLRQDERSTDLYFVESGLLSVQMEDEATAGGRLVAIQPGSVIGELAFYLGGRSAAVVATKPSRLQRLSASSLEAMSRNDPRLAAALHRGLARRVAERLADQNRVLAIMGD